MSVTEEPAGGNCAAGGQRVQSGMDDDRDGLLDGGEVDSTSYVCDGGGVVVRATSAAWGGVCTFGGVRLDSGVDDDRDGQLGDGTTTQRAYADGVSALTGAAEITAGSYHSCTRQQDGTARCWGGAGTGQLGDGSWTDRTTPVDVLRVNDLAP